MFFPFFFPAKKSVLLGNKYGGTGINMEEQFAQMKKSCFAFLYVAIFVEPLRRHLSRSLL